MELKEIGWENVNMVFEEIIWGKCELFQNTSFVVTHTEILGRISVGICLYAFPK
jgi:hypothetical protein